MKINVTKKNIKSGKRSNAFYCPIALAILERVNKNCCIDGTSITIFEKGTDNSKTYLLPFQAQKFINYFDNNKKVKPFSFSIKLDN